MSKTAIRAARRNEFKALRKLQAPKQHVWKTGVVVRAAYPLYVRLNRSQNLPRASSYAHAAKIAADRGFRDAK